MAPCLYFLHIPKTAGTTVTAYLDGCFRPETIFPYQLWSDYVGSRYAEHDEAASPFYRLYRGHFGMGFRTDTAKDPVVITFVREPARQLASMFNHMLIDGRNGTEHHPGMTPTANTLSRYLERDENRQRVTNIQARYLVTRLNRSSCTDDHLAAGSFLAPIHGTDTLADQTSDPGPDGVSDGTGDVGLDRVLDGVAFVGVQEYLAESLILLALEIGLPLPSLDQLRDRRMTLPAEHPGVDEGLVDRLSGLDRALHRRSKQRIEDRFDELAASVGIDGPGLARSDGQTREATVERVLAVLAGAAPSATCGPQSELDSRADADTCADPDANAGAELDSELDRPRFVADPVPTTVTMAAGGETTVELSFTNRSTRAYFGYTRLAPTSQAPLLLATDEPVNRESEFVHHSWFSPNRPCSEFTVTKAGPGRPDAIEPGDTATATFRLQAPPEPGLYRERFTVVIEGVVDLSDEIGFELAIEVR